jgi:hypothetical protein
MGWPNQLCFWKELDFSSNHHCSKEKEETSKDCLSRELSRHIKENEPDVSEE